MHLDSFKFKLFVFVLFFGVNSVLLADKGLAVDLNVSDTEVKQGQEILNHFATFLGQQAKVPVFFTFTNKEDEAIAQIKSGNFQFGLINFGFYLKHQKKLQFEVLLQEVPPIPEKFDFYLLTLKGKFASLDAYLEQTNETSMMSSFANEEDFLRRVALGKAIPKNIFIKKMTFTPTHLRYLKSNKFSSVLINGEGYHSLVEYTPKVFEELDTFKGPSLVGHVFVRMRDSSFSPKLHETFAQLGQNEEAKPYLKTLGIKEFKAVKDEDFDAFLHLFPEEENSKK